MVTEARAAKSQDVRLLARRWTRTAIHQISQLATNSTDERVRLAANQELLNRGHGRPAQAIMVMNASEQPAAVIDAVATLFGLGDARQPVDDLPILEAPARQARPLYAAGMWLHI